MAIQTLLKVLCTDSKTKPTKQNKQTVPKIDIVATRKRKKKKKTLMAQLV